MKIVFIGCVKIGLDCLKQILKDKSNVVTIFTLAKKYAEKTSGFVDFTSLAKTNKITLCKTKHINDKKNISKIKKLAPDLIVICGWQQLVNAEILGIPPKGVIGFHSSLLPEYRGRAPVNWAIINGEKQTGITMFYCQPEADTGDIIAQKSFPININDNCGSVYNKSAKAACQLLHKYLPVIKKGKVIRKKNFSKRYRFWPKRRPEDGRINWNLSALELHNWIRALTHPYPGAFTYYGGKKYFIWGSRLSRNRLKCVGKPGEILKIRNKKNNSIELLVKTFDMPIYINNLSSEQRKLPLNFERGKCFI